MDGWIGDLTARRVIPFPVCCVWFVNYRSLLVSKFVQYPGRKLVSQFVSFMAILRERGNLGEEVKTFIPKGVILFLPFFLSFIYSFELVFFFDIYCSPIACRNTISFLVFDAGRNIPQNFSY